MADFELGSRAEELLHPDFSRWPSQALRGGSSPTGRAVKLYQPIALQTIGKQKVPQEHAFKALTHQICAAAAGEYAFLECVPRSFCTCLWQAASVCQPQHARFPCHVRLGATHVGLGLRRPSSS